MTSGDRRRVAGRKRLYYAAPLFSEAERKFNADLERQLESIFDMYLPQRDGGTLTELIECGSLAAQAAKAIFDRDMKALVDCDVLLAVLDGRSVDEGVAFELGFAYSNGKLCLGLQTDIRRLRPAGNNPMIDNSLDIAFCSVEDLIGWTLKNSESGHS